MSAPRDQSNDDSDDEGNLDMAAAAYSFKLNILKSIAKISPRQFPKDPIHRASKNRGNKSYCVLWSSGDLIAYPEDDKSILIPFVTGCSPNLNTVRKALTTANKGRYCVLLLSISNRINDDLRIFRLEKFGLQMICLPDPRPESILKSTSPDQCRVNIPLIHEDNRLASVLLLAENDFDLSLVQDIFGPIVIMRLPESEHCPKPKDIKVKHLQELMSAYFGCAKGYRDLVKRFDSDEYLQQLSAATFQPIPEARRAYKHQVKGKAPPTDLMTHAPPSAHCSFEKCFYVCGNPNCPDRKPGRDRALMLCTGCHGIYYCSPSCQRSDWKNHKPSCQRKSDEELRHGDLFASCGNPACPGWNDDAGGKVSLMLCTGCQGIYYCSPSCQRSDWKNHKPSCHRKSAQK